MRRSCCSSTPVVRPRPDRTVHPATPSGDVLATGATPATEPLPTERRIAGAVLTGGRSSRMGADKALLRVDGTPLARRVADVLLAAGCSPVVAAGGDGDRLRELGLRVLDDAVPDQPGPAAGILAALRALTVGDAPAGDADACAAHRPRGAAVDAVFVAACDLVDLDVDTARTLVRTAVGGGADVVVAHTGRREPTCAVWRSSMTPIVAQALDDGTRAVHRIIEMAPTVREVGVDPVRLRNVNAPADLAE